MNLVYWAIIGIALFLAVWMLFVVPAERRHHERKLEIIQKKLEKRGMEQEDGGASTNEEKDKGES